MLRPGARRGGRYGYSLLGPVRAGPEWETAELWAKTTTGAGGLHCSYIQMVVRSAEKSASNVAAQFRRTPTGSIEIDTFVRTVATEIWRDSSLGR